MNIQGDFGSKLRIGRFVYLSALARYQREVGKIVRRDIRIAPSFLTGIDWKWLDDVIPVGLAPVWRGREAGAYALLLRQVEDRQRDSTILRSADADRNRW